MWDHVRWHEPVVAVADPWIAPAAIAMATTSVRLGPMVTPLARRRPAKVAQGEHYTDIVAALPPGSDPAPYAAAGATWWVTEFPPDGLSVDEVRGVIGDGPFGRPHTGADERRIGKHAA